MKDDLVEQVSATIKRLTRAHAPATPEELARAILAIARPAILEEAAKFVETGGTYPLTRASLAEGIRALAHTTGKEGGR